MIILVKLSIHRNDLVSLQCGLRLRMSALPAWRPSSAARLRNWPQRKVQPGYGEREREQMKGRNRVTGPPQRGKFIRINPSPELHMGDLV